MREMLLVDHFDSGIEISLNESKSNNGLIKFRGKFQEAETPNKNNRIYSFDVLNENVEKLSSVIKKRGLVGECDHAIDSIIHFQTASHVITKLWWENNVMMGEGEILSTPHGKVLKALLNDGVRVGISSRGVGSGKTNENGMLVINENYKLITFDIVADPSTYEAFQEKINKNENYSPKILPTRINTLSKEAVIAAIGGIIKQKTKSVKERIF